jgi:DinB superfamily
MDNILNYATSILGRTPLRWQELTQHVPGDLLSRLAAEGEWSAVQCLQHLLDAEETVFPVRVKAILAGQDFPGFNPATQSGKPSNNFAEMAAKFALLRNDSLELIKTVKMDDLPRKARHSELGVVTMEELLHEWAAHDLMHTVQGERALMQPFIQGSGPWHTYFTDHDIRLKQKS